ncbi:hypothetical protein EGI26_00645 [Lacihabitans sp. CCS-44]|uniref:EboA domain-containing protein n=1 Tax=Lacihabitans sp. CCS-44 TaxID=2487331 RepID=UPI0020CFD908|nr:EboA domain-containing protein [Lacihabitans sp. CCS-44]MCP9753669.1 hypothetical protein [Lacihabitans sp. CCS-44]
MNAKDNLFEIIKANASQKELNWIETKATGSLQSLQTAFVATPRFISKTPINTSVTQKGIDFQTWTLDKLVRAYFLTSLNISDKETYTKTLNTLFETAENNEAVALTSSLALLENPETWLLRATDAVRTNIGVVFDAIAFENPYPQEYFSELAWNQLVLKCIFNDKPIHRIQGLDERTNKELATSISNLAHERWAAGRSIPPQAWRLVVKYLDEEIFEDIKRLFGSESQNDQIAAALVCKYSEFGAAKSELEKHPDLEENTKDITWSSLEL